MVEFREAMVDAVLGAGEVKRVGTEGLMTGDQLLKLCDSPAAMGCGELKAVVPSEEEATAEQVLL